MAAVFPQLTAKRYYASGPICELLRAVRLPGRIQIAFDLEDSAPEWWAAIVSSDSWENEVKSIQEFQQRPTPEQTFGLTSDAARLLEWIESRRAKEMLGAWTPVVEPAIDTDIGFTSDWPEENRPAFLQMLTDEINDKTPYHLTLQPWKEQGQMLTRIKVAKKNLDRKTLEQTIVRAARENGINLSEDNVAKIVAAVVCPTRVQGLG